MHHCNKPMPRRTTSTSSSVCLYPIVQDLTEEEYNGQSRGLCCCPNTNTAKNTTTGKSLSSSLSSNPCAKWSKWLPSSSTSRPEEEQPLPPQRAPMREQSPNLPTKTLLRARKAFPLMDMCVTNTFSSDGSGGENAPPPTFENTYVLTRQVRCGAEGRMGTRLPLFAIATYLEHLLVFFFMIALFVCWWTDLSMRLVASLGMCTSCPRSSLCRQNHGVQSSVSQEPREWRHGRRRN